MQGFLQKVIRYVREKRVKPLDWLLTIGMALALVGSAGEKEKLRIEKAAEA